MIKPTRRPAFDANSLGDLDNLLPPAPVPAKGSEKTPTESPLSPQTVVRGDSGSARSGGVDDTRGAEKPRTLAVRIPRQLYMALYDDVFGSMQERPSYAQLVTWTIEDYPEDTMTELGPSWFGSRARPADDGWQPIPSRWRRVSVASTGGAGQVNWRRWWRFAYRCHRGDTASRAEATRRRDLICLTQR
jgi:hypothetical protein